MITLNEERRLPVTLRALTQVADEIIVVDAGSTDRTREIAASFGAFVYEREWDNYSAQKRYAESLCKGDWLINVDADEEISPELVREILYAIGEETYQVLRVHIIDIFPGHKKPNRLVRHYNVIRLYKRGYASMGETYTCDRVAFLRDDARVGQLDSLIYHRSF